MYIGLLQKAFKTASIPLMLLFLLISCDEKKSEASRLPEMLPGIKIFLESHSEFGRPIETQTIPDWAQGKRQRVQFSNGRNLLFYLKDGKVTTIWEDIPEEGRKKIWGSTASPPEDLLKEKERKSDGSLPAYTIIRSMKLATGGRQADIMIPNFSRDTPEELRKKTALKILENEGLVSVSLYSTREALKADMSSSYAETNPEAKEGILGGIYNGKWIYFE